jgi:hypothetical protein
MMLLPPFNLSTTSSYHVTTMSIERVLSRFVRNCLRNYYQLAALGQTTKASGNSK